MRQIIAWENIGETISTYNNTNNNIRYHEDMGWATLFLTDSKSEV